MLLSILPTCSFLLSPSFRYRSRVKHIFRSTEFSTGETSNEKSPVTTEAAEKETLYRAQGLFAVVKPLEWTSQDVVSYLRGMIERDARHRGVNVQRMTRRKRGRKNVVKIGHGGTLDPLATGVLVIGVGSGTKELQR